MAERIVSNVSANIIMKLVTLGGQEIGLLRHVKREVKKLRDTVSTIEGVLQSAEEQQEQNPAVRTWLENLKEVFDEADDFLDDVSTEALRREVTRNKKAKKVRIFFSKSNQLAYGLKLAYKIKAIRERLDAVAADRKFHLEERPVEIQVRSKAREQTHSFVLEKEVIGREHDKKAIIQLLILDFVEENVSILPIVGMGGLGKTTLAQLVFNHEKIQRHFEKKMWVCVSDNFDVKVVVEKILESITKKKSEKLEMNTLVEVLMKEIDGKRYLIVLDDVWDDDRAKWDSLRAVLRGGARGSRILVTTRIAKVAEITKTIEPYLLSGLDNDNSWTLFKQKAFQIGQEPNNLKIVEIGKEIVNKCVGVPLALRTLGSMLYFKKSEVEWLSFKNCEISKISQNDESGILPTLKLSYDHLPSHLKQCFAFCKLFAKDYKIDIPTLINLWIAQGFISLSDHNQCLEDVGLDYFMDLLWRSFFQEVVKDEWGNVKKCKMHNLMHDLAIKVAGKESIILDSNVEKIDEKTRHVSFGFELDLSQKNLTPLSKISRMRTFLLPHQSLWNDLVEGIIMDESTFGAMLTEKKTKKRKTFEAIVSSFRFLRVLDMHTTGIHVVPTSISKVKHLRYLDLSKNKYIKRLPNSISELVNLQTLRLSECSKLKALPKDIYKLVNLRCLEIDGCNALTYMPHGLGELTNLRTLSEFVVAAKDNSVFKSGLKELHGLNKLRGDLKIRNLRRGKDAALESKDANLKEKEHIRGLTLSWGNEDISNTDNEGYDEMSLEGFDPNPNLQKLSLNTYHGVRFPNWLPSLSNLQKFSLVSCNFQHLPPLDKLFPSLKSLSLKYLRYLQYISSSKESGSSDELSVSSFFPFLEELTLEFCCSLKGWWRKWDSVEVEEHHLLPLPSFPRLSSLSITICPSLTSMPLFPYLTTYLCLDNASIKPLQQIMNMKNMASPPKSPTSTTTILTFAPSTSSSTSFAPLSNLKYLYIKKIDELKSLSEDCLRNLTSLEELDISDCNEFDLWNIDGNGMQWQGLRSLRTLKINKLPKLASLPVWLQHVTTLQLLQIDSCDNLITIPDWICNLSALQQLFIWRCRSLTSLPQGMRVLTSLQSLHISCCPILSQRCTWGGKDWPNISHIPDFRIRHD